MAKNFQRVYMHLEYEIELQIIQIGKFGGKNFPFFFNWIFLEKEILTRKLFFYYFLTH